MNIENKIDAATHNTVANRILRSGDRSSNADIRLDPIRPGTGADSVVFAEWPVALPATDRAR